jgi:Kef-type K+ transport system membrane component KefB
MGYGTAVLFGANTQESVFIALALAATSVSISAQTLLELDVLRSRVGLGLLGAAVFDDILVILSLSVAFIIWGGGGGDIGAIILTLLQMVAYLVVASALGFWFLPRLVRWVDRLPISEGTIAFVLVLTLLYSWAAEVLGGVATITGAFLVGLFLARLPFRERIEHGISTLAYGFFVPIFFVNIGLEVNMRAISGGAWWFALTLTAVAVISKLAGSGVGAKLGGLSTRESIQLGIGMVSRGEVGLIVASFALLEGLVSQENFSITVFMVIVATLLTPPMLRAAFASGEEPGSPQPQLSEKPSQQAGD